MVKEYATAFTTNPDHYADDNPDNHKPKNVLDDTFDELKSQLTQPTREEAVEAAVSSGQDIPVILWRGTRGTRVADMIGYGCARGQTKNEGIGRPAEADRQNQIGRGAVLPEFTTKTDLSFCFRHWLVVVQISAKYLARGSVNEQGWVAPPEAPVVVLEVVDRTLGFTEPEKEPNAS